MLAEQEVGLLPAGAGVVVWAADGDDGGGAG
jgi:hypothetical protein